MEEFATYSKYPSLNLRSSQSKEDRDTTIKQLSRNIINKHGSSSNKLQRSVNDMHKVNVSVDRRRRNVNNFSSDNNDNNENSNSQNSHCKKKIILLHDPPIYNDSQNGSSNRQNVFDFLLSCQCPVIMIISNITAKDDYHYTVERCLPQSIKQRLLSFIIATSIYYCWLIVRYFKIHTNIVLDH